MRKGVILVFLMLTATLAASNLFIFSSVIDPSPAQAGSELYIKIILQNVGDTSARNAVASLELDDPFLMKVERERTQSFDTISASNFAELEYHLYVDPSAKSGTYPLKLKIDYVDGAIKKGVEKDIEITVRNYKHTIGVSQVTVSKDILYPGDTTDLILKVKNYGVEEIKQVELTLSVPSKMNILGSTKRFFLEKLTSNSELTASYRLVVDSDAEMGAYQFPLSIKIADNYGNEQTFTDSIGVQVYSQPEIEFSIRSYDVKTGKISTLIANRGHATAQYTIVKIEGVDATPAEIYIGNLESDDYSTADFTVTPKRGKAIITVRYVDSSNVEQTISQEVQVYPAPPSNGTLYIVIGLVVVIGLVYWFFLRNKKAGK